MGLERLYEVLINEGRVMFPQRLELTLGMSFFHVWHPPEGVPEDDERLLREINDFFRKTGREKEFASVRDLIEAYQIWVTQFMREIARDVKVYQRIIEIQSDLEKIQSMVSSPIVYDRERVAVTPLLRDGTTPMPINGIDIFNQAALNSRIPFVHFNENITSSGITDVYNTVTLSKYFMKYPLNTSVVIPKIEKRQGRNTMYSTFWTGSGEPEKATKKSYVRGIYNLEKNRFVIDVPTSTDISVQKMISWAEDVFSTLQFPDTVSYTTVRGYFQIYALEINEISFLDMILNDPLFNAYLYVDERSEPMALKKSMTLHYRSYLSQAPVDDDTTSETKEASSLSAVRSVITQHTVEEKKLVFFVDPDDGVVKQTELDVGTPYVQVKISRAISKEAVTEFMTIFLRLMGGYMYGLPTVGEAGEVEMENLRLQIEELYTEYVPGDVSNFHLRRGRETATGRGSIAATSARVSGTPIKRGPKIRSNRGQWIEFDPVLFLPPEIGRAMQPLEAIPKILEEDEVEEHQNQTFDYKGETLNRQVLKYPPDRERFAYFGCTDDRYVFPHYKGNPHYNPKTDKPWYKCLPSCATSNYQPSHNPNRLWEWCDPRSEEEEELTASVSSVNSDVSEASASSYSSTHIPVRADIMEPGRPAEISIGINRILQMAGGTKYRRMGVPKSPNSLIHCVEMAYQNPGYQATEAYVQGVRLRMIEGLGGGRISMAVLKQQLFDVSDQQILADLADLESFLDPRLYYRLVEEYYGINIFVFSTVHRVTRVMTPGAEGEGILEIPRYKLFYARAPHRERQTICVLKSWGTAASAIEHPQCELIFDTAGIRIFGAEMTDVLMAVTSQIVNTASCTVTPDQVVHLYQNTNVFVNSLEYFNGVIGTSPLAQFVDSYGKCRGLVYVPSPPDATKIYVIIPPTEPVNLPLDNLAELVLPSLETVRSVLSRQVPKAVTRTETELLGLWYSITDTSISLVSSYYIPINPTGVGVAPDLTALELGPSDPLYLATRHRPDYVARSRKLKRDMSIILQLVLWLYLLAQLPIVDFVNTYSVVDFDSPSPPDTATLYDFSGLNRLLPRSTTISEALTYLHSLNTGFTMAYNNQIRIWIYSQKLYEGLLYYLKLFEDTVPPNPVTDNPDLISIQRQLPVEIKGLYESEADFIQFPFNVVFTGEVNLQTWLEFNKRDLYRRVFIKTELSPDLANLYDPYLYIEGEQLYMIQNTFREDSFGRAIQIALIWEQQKINPGFMVEPFAEKNEAGEPVVPPYVLYSISSGKTLNQKSGDDGVLVLEYSEGVYAALLPLV